MTARCAVLALLTTGAALLGGCGGGETCDVLDLAITCDADDGEDHEPPPNITIATPSTTGYYVTSAASAHIAGTTSRWDADIEWRTGAGASGWTDPQYELCFACRYDWAIEVPLELGDNRVTVVVSNAEGSGEATIRITRQPSQGQWAWAR
jgi:hypothetical protein